ncbi:hypothetical protein Glove_9g110 [Diversispora epigaea]|uniref:Uncharacterized protein n=1 Tax=Diversispora epigaea TaxID=1348612 RepID=A0A397JYQ4_9GLOM|nr:hypothetical protein Glove_9g110 [Diversispora epigaea]
MSLSNISKARMFNNSLNSNSDNKNRNFSYNENINNNDDNRDNIEIIFEQVFKSRLFENKEINKLIPSLIDRMRIHNKYNNLVSELKNKNIKIKIKNAKLKHDKEEVEIENIKLKQDLDEFKKITRV